MKYTVKNIDAWRDCNGWYHNLTWSVGDIEIPDDCTTRALLKLMREYYLSSDSKGKVSVDWSIAPDFIEIQRKSNLEPLYLLEADEWV